MRKISGTAPYVTKAASASGYLVVWNRRLLVAASVFILWAASVLALQAAGPRVQALLAGEGTLITETR